MVQEPSCSEDEIIKELMKQDRLYYLEILRKSGRPLTSYEVTKEILVKYRGVSERLIDSKLLRKKNPSVNTRLKTMQDMGILKNINGRYSIDIAGLLFLHAREKLSESRKILGEHKMLFETHNFQDLPVEFRWQIYKLRQTEMIRHAYDYLDKMQENLKKVRRKIYLLTEYLHDIPDEIIQRIQEEEIDIAILYQCYDPPRFEREDEKELFKRMTENPHEGIEFRFLPLRERFPIYIGRIDSNWALFALSALANGTIDRDQAFCGDDIEFVTWCRDLLYHLWWEEDVVVLDIQEILKVNSL